MEPKGGVTPSRMALELAEASRLDLTCNFKDWRRAVVEAVRTREAAPVSVPRDWAFEVQIALNYLLLLCVRDTYGRAAMAVVRTACLTAFIEQVAETGASSELLDRIEKLQADRFAALDRIVKSSDRESLESRLSECLVEGVVGAEALGRPGAAALGVRFMEFRSAMKGYVGSMKLSEIRATR